MWFIGLFAAAVFYIISVLVCHHEDRKRHHTLSKLDPKNTPPAYGDDMLSYKKDMDAAVAHFKEKREYQEAISDLIRFFYVGQRIRVPHSGEYYVIRFFHSSSRGYSTFNPLANTLQEKRDSYEYIHTPDMYGLNKSGCYPKDVNICREKMRVKIIITVCHEADYIPADHLIEFKDKPRPNIDKVFCVSNYCEMNVQNYLEVYDGNQYINVLDYIKHRIDAAVKLNDEAAARGFDLSNTSNFRLIDDYTKYHR